MKKLSEKKTILGVGFTPNSKGEILEYIIEILVRGGQKISIVTPNPEMILLARRSERFKTVLNSATIALPDGMGVVVASKLLRGGVEDRIAGVDFMEMLIKRVSEDFEKSAKRPASIGFIGGRGGVAERTADCLAKKYPGPDFYFYSGDFNPVTDRFQVRQMRKIGGGESVNLLSKGHLDILFVAFGFPRQEEWIMANLPHIPVNCSMGVGGSFDIISGKIKRAPHFFQKAGLEWSWRLLREPWRVKRQIRLIQFPYVVIREKFTKR